MIFSGPSRAIGFIGVQFTERLVRLGWHKLALCAARESPEIYRTLVMETT